MAIKLTLKDIETAQRALKGLLKPSPLLYNPWLSERLGCEVYLKLENMQPIGSFKIRGATYRISRLTEAEKKKGVIAASAGNHAQGVAWGCRHLGVSAKIVMPQGASLIKAQNTKALGAEVILSGSSYEEAYQEALRISSESGRVFIHAFNDPLVIAGQGTIGLEIYEQLPDVDMVIASIGGGGLLAGIATALKTKSKKIEIIGCQAEGASSMVRSLRKGRIIQGDRAKTFADGIAVSKVTEALFKLLKGKVDRLFEIPDQQIASAVLALLENAKILAEGSAAISLSALEKMALQFPKKIKGKKVVLVICGGNMDVNLLSRIIELGLIQDGRRLRVNVAIEDRPGSLNRLTEVLSKTGANILQAIHDRGDPKIDQAEVELLLETKGAKHRREILRELKSVTFGVKVIH